MLFRIATYVVGPYLASVALMFLLQRRLLYFPNLNTPADETLAREGLRFWPRRESYRGLVSVAPPRDSKGTVVVFHGNNSLSAQRGFYARALERLGYRTVLAEYPVYGGRNGKLSETEFVADARETVRQVYEEFGGPLFILGESLGSGVATAVAADRSLPIAGLILITPFDSISALAQTLYWFIPARWMVWDKFDSVTNLRSFHGPVAVLMAERDNVVPKQHTIGVYESIPGPKELWRFEGASHTDWAFRSEESWWREVMEFVTANSRQLPEVAGQKALYRNAH
jgi:alpha-beta hydrolase superfamily lysophospholipase